MRTEIKISGLGGQGVILVSVILGHAAVLDGKHAAQTRSYGAETRGTVACGDVVISDKPIAYPMTTELNILVAMCHPALVKYVGMLKNGGILIVDDTLIRQVQTGSHKTYKIPATEIAEKIGNKAFANMAMLGFLAGVTKIVSNKSLKKAVIENMPKDRDKNIKAVKLGLVKAKKLAR